VRDKMESLALPLEAKPPVLLALQSFDRADHAPGAVHQGQGFEAELTRLRRYADDDLKKKLEPVEGVAAVKVGGGLEDEVQVDIDQQKLAQLNLPIDTVIQRLQQENINISGGPPGGRLAALPGSHGEPVRQRRRNPRHARDHAGRRWRRCAERGGGNGARGGGDGQRERDGRGRVGAERVVGWARASRAVARFA
jgi:hypothetical protein